MELSLDEQALFNCLGDGNTVIDIRKCTCGDCELGNGALVISTSNEKTYYLEYATRKLFMKRYPYYKPNVVKALLKNE